MIMTMNNRDSSVCVCVHAYEDTRANTHTSLQCLQVMLPVQMHVFIMYTGVYTSQSPKYHSLVQSCSSNSK